MLALLLTIIGFAGAMSVPILLTAIAESVTSNTRLAILDDYKKAANATANEGFAFPRRRSMSNRSASRAEQGRGGCPPPGRRRRPPQGVRPVSAKRKVKWFAFN
jgi:hypothetical protein